MSDIPPELLEELRKLERRDAVMDRWFKWGIVAMVVLGVLMLFMPGAHAASLDRTDVYCELFELDSGTGRYYIAADPAWTPECVHPWVTLRKDKFQTLVDAFEGGSSSPSQFTADEVAMLKWQAANPSPFNLSLGDGGLVGGSVLAVWALASIFKTITRQVSDHFSPSED